MNDNLTSITTIAKNSGNGKGKKRDLIHYFPNFKRITSFVNRLLAVPRTIAKKWRRWRAGIFLNQLRRMLLKLNHKLQNAGYPRNERRMILHNILKDIKGAQEFLGDK
jgi:hypothetical protein